VDAEVSQRLAYIMRFVIDSLTEQQYNYIIQSAERAQNFDALPLDVQQFINDSEMKYGAHPLWRDTLIQREQELEKQLDAQQH
jgi:hypothetical protein